MASFARSTGKGRAHQPLPLLHGQPQKAAELWHRRGCHISWFLNDRAAHALSTRHCGRRGCEPLTICSIDNGPKRGSGATSQLPTRNRETSRACTTASCRRNIRAHRSASQRAWSSGQVTATTPKAGGGSRSNGFMPPRPANLHSQCEQDQSRPEKSQAIGFRYRRRQVNRFREQGKWVLRQIGREFAGSNNR
jgi:hypothetical protein